MVTGTHYGTKTSPGQQPTNPSAGDIYMLQVWSLGYAARLGVRLGGFSYRLFVFAVSGIPHQLDGRVRSG